MYSTLDSEMMDAISNHFKITDEIEVSMEKILGLKYNRSFPKELADVFKEIIDFVKENTEYRETQNEKITELKKLRTNIQKTFGSRIEKIIEKELGCHINIEFISVLNAAFTFSDPSTYFVSYDNFEDLISYGVNSLKNDQYTKNMINAIGDYDINLGKFLTTRNVDKIKPKIYIGTFLFKVDDLTNGAIGDLSPDEITAIIIHEIGHFMFLIAGYLTGGYTGINIAFESNKLRNRLKNENSIVKGIELVKQSVEYSASLLDNLPSLDDKIKSFVTKTKDAFLNIIDTLIKDHDISSTEAFDTILFGGVSKLFGLIKNLASMFFTVIKIIFIVNSAYVMASIIFNIISEVSSGESISFLSPSDQSKQLLTIQSVFDNERFADEFASRYGMSAYLSGALAKISSVNVRPFEKKKSIQKSLMFTSIMTETIASTMKNNFLGKNIFFFAIYEYITDRLRRFIQNNLAILKDETIPVEFRDSIVEQNQYIRNVIKETKKLYGELNTNKAVFDPILSLFYRGNPLVNIKYGELVDKIDSLAANPIIESSYRLKRMVMS